MDGRVRPSRPGPTSCSATTWCPDLLREVVAAVGDRAELEATGNLTLDRGGVRRDRRRLPVRRRADPLVADPRHRAGPAGRRGLVLARAFARSVAALHRHREHEHRAGHVRRRQAGALLADQDRRPVHGGRAGPDVPRPAGRRRRRDHRRGGLLHRAGRAALAAHHAGPLLRRPADVCRAGCAHRRAAGDRQPQGGRRRPGGQHPRRVHPVRRPVDRGRLRHHHQLRRDQRARASSSAARSRRASRSPSTRSRPGPRSCARSSRPSPAR